jgi:hypothetical protein
MHLLALDGSRTRSDPRQRRSKGQQGTKVSEARLITWHWHVYRSDSDSPKIRDVTRPHIEDGLKAGRRHRARFQVADGMNTYHSERGRLNVGEERRLGDSEPERNAEVIGVVT